MARQPLTDRPCQPVPGCFPTRKSAFHSQSGFRSKMSQALLKFASAEPWRLLISLVVIMSFVGLNAAYLVWVERKGAGRFQRRPGPTEAGPAGLLQPIADAVKLMTKQVLVLPDSDRTLFRLAPMLVMAPALMCLATIP